jgi:hypothetical protein
VKINTTLYLLWITLLGIACPLSAVDNDEILDLVLHEVDVDVIYNQINAVEWSDSNISELIMLWNGNAVFHPDVHRSADEISIIRLAIANVLMQVVRHCINDDVGMGKLHDFVLSAATSDSASIRGRATLLLGLAGYDSDIPFLVSVVESEKEGYAEEAARSISFIDSPASLEALRDLRERVSRKSLNGYIDDLVTRYETLPPKVAPKGCGKVP